MKILHLTLKKQWFDMIEAGLKPEEYREIKPYWEKRLVGRNYDAVHFRNGYSKDSRQMRWKIAGIGKGRGNPALGAPVDKDVFIVMLGTRI